jgi:hypothetical protein
MKNEVDILADVSSKLQQLGIAYMVTGSMALNYYAQPRLTRDIDIVVLLTAADVPRLMTAFAGEYYIAEEALVTAVRRATIFNLIHTESVIKVDCIVRKNTEHGRAEFERRQPVVVEGHPTFVATKEDLILAKLSWARSSRSEKQLTDVKNLLSEGYDREYVEQWARKLSVDDLLEECRNA